MTCITEIINKTASETSTESSCTALISIAARAAGYDPIMRKNQLSKVCIYHENITSACTTAPTSTKHQAYIVC